MILSDSGRHRVNRAPETGRLQTEVSRYGENLRMALTSGGPGQQIEPPATTADCAGTG